MRAQAAMISAQRPNAPQAAPNAPAGPHPLELQAKLLGEQNKARQMELAAHRDQVNDENRDLDREKDLRVQQMRMDQDQMNDQIRMQHELDLQTRDHQTDILKLAMQVQSNRGKR
jgi:hypothetical protein